MNRCQKCHRSLKGEKSVLRGYGRTCFVREFGSPTRSGKQSKLIGHDWQQVGLFDEVEDADESTGI